MILFNFGVHLVAAGQRHARVDHTEEGRPPRNEKDEAEDSGGEGLRKVQARAWEDIKTDQGTFTPWQIWGSSGLQVLALSFPPSS